MARRPSRHGAPRRRWAVFSLAALAVLAVLGWLAPTVLVFTQLRDRPLEAALAGIDGSVTSGSARWGWLRGIEYRDVVLRGRDGRPALIVPLVVVERGLLALAIDPHALGTVRLVGPEALVEVRRGGSSLEDILAPWLAAKGQAATGGAAAGTPLACDLEVVDAVIEFTDLDAGEAWRVSDLIAAAGIDRSGGLTGWTVAGRLRHAGRRDAAPAAQTASPPAPGGLPAAPRLDRTTIPAATAAMLAREGGWSVAAGGGADPRAVTIAAHRLPLGASSILASRFALDHVVDGLADVRLDGSLHAAGADLRGSLALTRLAVCTAGTLVERVAIERVEVPLDLSIAGRQVTVRSLAASAPMIALEAAGRFELPQGDLWTWADGLAAGDFAATAKVDLAAAARALPAGIAVRPDVRLSAGRLEIGAAARPDGATRVLEVRIAARDLEAEQQVAPPADGADPPAPAATATTRPLAWREPFTAWLRGRRGPGAGDRLRLEELRITAAGTEITATGSAGALELQWTAELGTLTAAAGELVDLGGATVAGRSSGRVDMATGAAGTTAVKLAASATDLVVERPGRPAWRDEELVVEADAEIAVAAGVTTVSHARTLVAAGADRLEARCTGGVLVDGAAAAPRIRPATAEPISAEGSIAGELSRWQARLAALVPAAHVAGLEIAGRVAAGVAVTNRVAEDGGEVWQITRAGGEIERFEGRRGERRLAEPRIVCTAAGAVFPARGRIDLTALELLSATMSLRSAGLSWLPAKPGSDAPWQRVRGRLQWQADLGRLAGWFAPVEPAAPAPSGRAWGTIDLVDVPAGTNLLVEATGSQLAITRPAAAGALWSEPRATLAVEVTRPGAGDADRLRIDRLAVASSTLAVAATGSVEEWSARRLLRLDGTATYDWEKISRLLSPWTGGRLRIAGTGDRPFTLRAALGRGPAAALAGSAAAAEPAALPLPDDWLTATRRGDGATARVARPVAARAVRDERLQSLAVDTSTAWAGAEIDGLKIAAGEMAVRLLEGQLALGPFDVAAAGGRLRGAPWMRLEPWPGELVVPPGRVVERVALDAAACDRWVTWLSPVLGHSTHTAGLVTVDLAGARLPLADPFAGELAGQVVFEQLEVTPRQALAPLVNLLVRLQSAVDPRFAVGDKAVLLRVRPDPVRVRLAGGRLAHEGLVMDAGQLTLRSAGSVGADGSLAMTVEVALRAEVLGTTPVLAALVRTPLVIPLKGTVQRPQFDAGAIDLVLGRIIENTAQAVINDGLGRGLETLFGNPQPQAPLTLPPRP